jgi:hypothetical protein
MWGCGRHSHVAQDWGQFLAVTKTDVNPWVPYNADNFLTGWRTIIFTQRTSLHGDNWYVLIRQQHQTQGRRSQAFKENIWGYFTSDREKVTRGWRKVIEKVTSGWRKVTEKVTNGWRKVIEKVTSGWRKVIEKATSGWRKVMTFDILTLHQVLWRRTNQRRWDAWGTKQISRTWDRQAKVLFKIVP